MPTLSTHLSIVAPVPDAHLSFIDVCAVLSPVSCVLLEHDDLGVLAAELDHAADVGVELLHRHRHGVDLLHELRAEAAARSASRRSPVMNDADLVGLQRRERRVDLAQHVARHLGLARLVAQVLRPQDLFDVGVDDRHLHGRRADIDSDHDVVGCIRRRHGILARLTRQSRHGLTRQSSPKVREGMISRKRVADYEQNALG